MELKQIRTVKLEITDDKRNSLFSFWTAVVLTAVISPLSLYLAVLMTVNEFLMIILAPIFHYAAAAFIYGILIKRENLIRSFFVGVVSFILIAAVLSIFFGKEYLSLLTIGLALISIVGVLGTSIGVLAATVVKGNRVKKLP